MEMIDRVKKLLDGNKSNAYIARRLRISKASVRTYKANITRRESVQGAAKKLEEYMTAPYIVIPSQRVVERLEPEYIPGFVEVLDILLAENRNGDGSLEGKVSSEHVVEEETEDEDLAQPLPSSKIREIVIELKRKGLENEEVYEDPRLKGVHMWQIAGYLSHISAGTYNKKRK